MQAAGWTVDAQMSTVVRVHTAERLLTVDPPSACTIPFTVSGSTAVTALAASCSGTRKCSTSSSPGVDTLTAETATSYPATSVGFTAVWHADSTTVTAPAGMTARTSATTSAGPGYDSTELFDLQATRSSDTSTSRAVTTSPSGSSLDSALMLEGNAPSTVTLTWTAAPDTWGDGCAVARSPGGATAIAGRATTTWSDTTASTSGCTYVLRATAGSWRSAGASTSVAACP